MMAGFREGFWLFSLFSSSFPLSHSSSMIRISVWTETEFGAVLWARERERERERARELFQKSEHIFSELRKREKEREFAIVSANSLFNAIQFLSFPYSLTIAHFSAISLFLSNSVVVGRHTSHTHTHTGHNANQEKKQA